MNARKLSLFALAAAGLVASGSASAQARTYNFNDRDVAAATTGGCNNTLTATGNLTASTGNAILCQQSGNASTTTNSQTLTVTAWSSDTPSTSAYRTASVNDQGSNGFGITNQSETTGSPDHAADNKTPGGSDLFLLNFSTSQILNSVTVGWTWEDGDFQVLRWGGSGTVTSIAGKTATQLLTDGWVLMGGVQNAIGECTTTTKSGVTTTTCGYDTNQTFNSFNGSGLSSTSWIISAYNSNLGGTGHTTGVDAIKLLSIGTAAGKVSAPGTLALAGFGLLAAGFLRRRHAA